MTVISYSRAAQAAYQDLLRLHLEETTSELIGSVEERVRNGRHYLYDKFRIGTAMKSRYLGEGTPELRARLARATELKTEAEGRRATMARLARVLRAEGLRNDRSGHRVTAVGIRTSRSLPIGRHAGGHGRLCALSGRTRRTV